MKLLDTGFEGLVVIEPKVFGDERGFFLETFSKRDFEKLGLPGEFVQDNHSRSQKGVLRGLHFQKAPHPQGKLLRVVNGAILDVVVDIRRGSKTFGKNYSIEINDKNKKIFYVPPGFAHGFCVISDLADVFYKCTDLYYPEFEGGLRWDDPELKIAWPVQNPTVSAKDQKWPSFKDFLKS